MVLRRNLEEDVNLQVRSRILFASRKVTRGKLVVSWHKGNVNVFVTQALVGAMLLH